MLTETTSQSRTGSRCRFSEIRVIQVSSDIVNAVVAGEYSTVMPDAMETPGSAETGFGNNAISIAGKTSITSGISTSAAMTPRQSRTRQRGLLRPNNE